MPDIIQKINFARHITRKLNFARHIARKVNFARHTTRKMNFARHIARKVNFAEYYAKSHTGFAWYSGLINPLQSGVAYLYPCKHQKTFKLYLTILSHSKYILRKFFKNEEDNRNQLRFNQRRVQNPIRCLRWNVLRNYLTAECQ